MKQRDNFGGNLGMIIVAAGSAVGLGNVWRFPYELGQNGGAAFLLVYLFFTIVLGLPIMLTEFSLGRMGGANMAQSFRNLSNNKGHWGLLGIAGVLCALFIMGFYAVVCGWTLDYVYQSLTHGFEGKTSEILASDFQSFTSDAFRPLFWTMIFLVVNGIIVMCGVKQGIEKISKVLMPILFFFILLLCVRSLTLAGGLKGLQFLFYPDFSKLTVDVIFSAMGQAFFSLSVGMGCLMTYGSYISSKNNLAIDSLMVTSLDTLVAILSAIAIFPAVFAFGLNPSHGPELVYITLPSVFNNMPLGNIGAIIFFLLLTIAALTSAMSLLEVITAFISEEIHLSRKISTLIGSVAIALMAVPASFSIGADVEHYKLFGMPLFDFLDTITTSVLMPGIALFIALFAGWKIPRKRMEHELSNHGKLSIRYFNVFYFVLRYISPILIAMVLVAQVNKLLG